MKTIIVVLAICLMTAGGFAADSNKKFVVHEWGTFTSVQGGDGVLLAWQPFTAVDLPAFVYNWRRPGLGRSMPLAFQFGKGGIRSLQRMETPVIYFYSDRKLSADVTVKFPGGLITEWYPQAQEVDYKKASLLARVMAGERSQYEAMKDSMIAWRDVHVLPMGKSGKETKLPVTNGATNHYFAARETDSAMLRVAKGGTNGDMVEFEKLLFYRGAGNFATPLKVTVSDEGDVAVQNTGDAPLAHLFLLQINNGEGMWSQMKGIAGLEARKWQRLGESKSGKPEPAGKFQEALSTEMESSLVSAGLYPREAAAMVKTWRQSWFAEDGVRVLYILPRQWTDATLPLTLNPKPDELARVMVGRAEIIPLSTTKGIAARLQPASKGDVEAQKQLNEYAHRLGRFYGPAQQLANNLGKQSVR